MNTPDVRLVRAEAVSRNGTSITPLSPAPQPIPRPWYRQCGCVVYFGYGQNRMCNAHERQYGTNWRDVATGFLVGALLFVACLLVSFGERAQ